MNRRKQGRLRPLTVADRGRKVHRNERRDREGTIHYNKWASAVVKKEKS